MRVRHHAMGSTSVHHSYSPLELPSPYTMYHSGPIFFTKQEITRTIHKLPRNIKRQTSTAFDIRESAYYKVVKPLIFCLRLLGLFPYTIQKGLLQVSWCSGWTLYSAILVTSEVCIMFISISNFYADISFTFDNQLNTAIHIVVSAFMGLVALSVWSALPGLTEYFAKWSTFQEDLRLCGVTLKTKLKRMVAVHVAAGLGYAAASALVHRSLQGRSPMNPLVLIMSHAGIIVTGLLWLDTGLYARHAATLLLKRVGRAAALKDPREMAACRRSWLALADVMVDFGNVLGRTLLAFLLACCIAVIFNCYILLFNFIDGIPSVTNTIAARLFTVSGAIIVMVALCESGQRSTTAVGYNMVQELLRINALEEKEFMREVNMFMHTVNLRYPHMKVCGFLTLNRKLLVSLLSGAVTYLIVLVQFKKAEVQPTIVH